jgi:hypothetical protein
MEKGRMKKKPPKPKPAKKKRVKKKKPSFTITGNSDKGWRCG